MNLFDFTGKVVVVTGASSGLGADAARAYAAYGADVALLARRKERLETIADEIEATGKNAIAVQCDISKEESIKSAVEAVLACYGKIDILLNNAGIAFAGSVEDMTTRQWDMAMDVNVKGIFLTCKYVVPHMKARKYGRIVNIASVNAVIADKADALVRHAYNASKNAVVGLTTGMAASLAKHGITVNALGPGLFETEMTADTLFKTESFLQMYNSLCPTSRPGRQGELNGPILFLSSDAVSYTTGQFILVDGGMALV